MYLCGALLKALCQTQQLIHASHCNLPLQACLRVSIGHKDGWGQILHRVWDMVLPSMSAQWIVATITRIVSQEASTCGDLVASRLMLSTASAVDVCAPLQGQQQPEQFVSVHARLVALSAPTCPAHQTGSCRQVTVAVPGVLVMCHAPAASCRPYCRWCRPSAWWLPQRLG